MKDVSQKQTLKERLYCPDPSVVWCGTCVCVRACVCVCMCVCARVCVCVNYWRAVAVPNMVFVVVSQNMQQQIKRKRKVSRKRKADDISTDQLAPGGGSVRAYAVCCLTPTLRMKDLINSNSNRDDRIQSTESSCFYSFCRRNTHSCV